MSDNNIIIKNLTINTVDTTSGIFTGNNNATGWSSFSKTNSGLGSASNGKIQSNLNIVIDNDLIDTPIDHCNNINKKAGDDIPITENIQFDKINVNALDTNSTISLGQNSQSAWSSHSKNNSGSGSFYGKNITRQNSNVLYDNDAVDAPINTPYIKKKK